MIWLVLAFLVVLICISVFLGIVCWKYAKLLINIEDNMESVLDILDKRYYALSHIVHDNELLSNDEVVKRFLKEVEYTRNDVLIAAQNIANATSEIISDEEEVVAPNEEEHDE